MSTLLKLITCGSVDDGKSTLIGHMLYDAKLLFTDQEEALELESKLGSRNGGIDYSLLLDGLAAEREQGITIDVAYRYFTTEKRSFIVADTPGHEEYTRNMAVGASFADLAVILVDATKGVLTQTRRHTRICSLMGIRNFVFAVNKMDLIDYNRETFQKISKVIKVLVAEFELDTLAIIPVSATEGDNVANASREMPWYIGPTLLAYLEQVEVVQGPSDSGFTLPIQRVCRPDRTFRGFQGTVASGSVNVGDTVTILPSGTSSRVASILIGMQDAQDCSVGQPVTICLEDEVDVSRGCVLTRDAALTVSSMFTAKLLWMDDTDLFEGRNFLFKLGTKSIPGVVLEIKNRIDVNTGEEVAAEQIGKNEIAECDISLSEKVVFDDFDSNEVLGSFILIDRITHMTSACGVIEHGIERSDNLTWQNTDITRPLRCSHMGQRACTLWFTGLSGSGKSTLADAVEQRLYADDRFTMLLDGDNVRMGLNSNLGFDEADRVENIRRIAEVARLMNDAGLIVLTSFISPFIRDRRNAAEIIGLDSFIEVHVSTPLEECEKRDIKGLYAKARRHEISDFTGITSPYEAPENPAIRIDTSAEPLEESVERIIMLLQERISG